MLNGILWPDHIHATPYISDFVPNSFFYLILSGFHRAFATDVACRQGTLTPPDTCSRPFGTCICSTCWGKSFSELVVIFPDYALRISLGTFSALLSMKLRILEKIYHPTNNLSTPFRRKREEYWNRQLGTAASYGCNDHIDSIGNLTRPGCQSVHVMNLFDRTSRRRRNHGSRRYYKPEINDVSFDGLLSIVKLQLGLHHIRTRQYSFPLKMLHEWNESTLTLHFTDVASAEHRRQGIILDISSNRLFRAVRIGESSETRNRLLLKVKFANKGLDALNLSNMLIQKSVQSKIPPYFQHKESPSISYSFTRSVASKIFNYKASLQQIDFKGLSQNPTPCSCYDSAFLYAI